MNIAKIKKHLASGMLVVSGIFTASLCVPLWAKDTKLQKSWPTVPVREIPVQSWPEASKAPEGAPNIVLILVDDAGFGQTSTFGGPIDTPAFDSLAKSGLRYNSFHVAAVCSPTRAALYHVPQEWIDKYKGKFAKGWDTLQKQTVERQKSMGIIPAGSGQVPRPEGLPAWDSLSADEKELLARQMEVYAGFTEQTDYEIGRLLDAIREMGQANNTIVIEIFGDNGACPGGNVYGSDTQGTITERLEIEDLLGSELYMNHFSAAWAWAMNAPFRSTKLDESHLGGTTAPMVISWPGHIKDSGGLRTQFSHMTDMAPTLFEIAGIEAPDEVDGVEQIPLEGVSLVYTFDNAEEPSRHTLQYFTTKGNRAIYKDGWWAGNRYMYMWEPGFNNPNATDKDIDVRPWELYNLNEDFTQAYNLADKYPEKLKELLQVFDSEAKRNKAYPILPKMSGNPNFSIAGQGTN